jgi:hypothetical protein
VSQHSNIVGPDGSPVATSISKALLKLYFGDTKRKKKTNDGIDFLHAVVPSAYCDFVVLDSDWSELVEQATRAIRKALIEAPIARPFGSGPGDLVAFLEALETFPPAT